MCKLRSSYVDMPENPIGREPRNKCTETIKTVQLSVAYVVGLSCSGHSPIFDSSEHTSYLGFNKIRRICTNSKAELGGPRGGLVVLARFIPPYTVDNTQNSCRPKFSSQFNDSALPERDGLKSLQGEHGSEKIY
jgi:hypothetical protein